MTQSGGLKTLFLSNSLYYNFKKRVLGKGGGGLKPPSTSPSAGPEVSSQSKLGVSLVCVVLRVTSLLVVFNSGPSTTFWSTMRS